MTDEEMQVLSEGQVHIAELNRRERTSMDSWPRLGLVDYGSCGQISELAMSHLRESIPNGQKVRTEMAFKALQNSVELTGKWLRTKGYNV